GPVRGAAVRAPPMKPASIKPAPEKPATFEMASVESRKVELRPAQAASLVARADLSASSVIGERGFWQGMVEPEQTQSSAATKSGAPRRPAGAAVASVGPAAFRGLAPGPMPERGDTSIAHASA